MSLSCTGGKKKGFISTQRVVPPGKRRGALPRRGLLLASSEGVSPAEKEKTRIKGEHIEGVLCYSLREFFGKAMRKPSF